MIVESERWTLMPIQRLSNQLRGIRMSAISRPYVFDSRVAMLVEVGEASSRTQKPAGSATPNQRKQQLK